MNVAKHAVYIITYCISVTFYAQNDYNFQITFANSIICFNNAITSVNENMHRRIFYVCCI